jgi:hypothetical protein
MATVVQNLKEWFKELDYSERLEVVKFLYGGKALLRKGMYTGPYPTLIDEGLHVGPVPISSSTCPTCGRPY